MRSWPIRYNMCKASHRTRNATKLRNKMRSPILRRVHRKRGTGQLVDVIQLTLVGQFLVTLAHRALACDSAPSRNKPLWPRLISANVPFSVFASSSVVIRLKNHAAMLRWLKAHLQSERGVVAQAGSSIWQFKLITLIQYGRAGSVPKSDLRIAAARPQ